MKRFLFLLIMCLFFTSCQKGESVREVLLNPSLAEYDENIGSAAKGFSEKSFKPLSNHYWLDSDKPKYMQLYYKSGNGSHASGAEIGGFFAEYNKENNKWIIKAQATSFTENGSWGEAPVPVFIKLGPESYGFMMEPAGGGQGFTEHTLFLYGVVGKNFVQLLSIPTYSDNSGTGSPDSFTVKVNLSQAIDYSKSYYDLIARLSIEGKYPMSPDDEYAKMFGKSKEVRFIFKDGVYTSR